MHLRIASLFICVAMLLAAPHCRAEDAPCPQLMNLAGSQLAWDGQQTYGVVCTDVIEPEFVLFDQTGSILYDPVKLPSIPKGRSPEFKTVWTADGWMVFGRWLDPDFEGKNISTGNTFMHFHFWKLDGKGKVVQSLSAEVLEPDSYNTTAPVRTLHGEIKA